MSNGHQRLHELLKQDLIELKLRHIAETYREVLDEAARKNTLHAGSVGKLDRR